jgi:MOSC domain-containing protein YiiM
MVGPAADAQGETGEVLAVSCSDSHGPGKENRASITLVAGLGVEGDAHLGATVQHLSRKRRDASLPNLRQVHLLGVELLKELADRGFDVSPGRMGENLTTRGVDLLGLPTGARLQLGASCLLELTGLRNPCRQLEGIQPGLMAATLDRDADGGLIRRAGVMAVVLEGGEVRPGDQVRVEVPAGPPLPLAPV